MFVRNYAISTHCGEQVEGLVGARTDGESPHNGIPDEDTGLLDSIEDERSVIEIGEWGDREQMENVGA